MLVKQDLLFVDFLSFWKVESGCLCNVFNNVTFGSDAIAKEICPKCWGDFIGRAHDFENMFANNM